MKSLRSQTLKDRCRDLYRRVRSVKNIEIIIAAVLAVIAITVYVGLSLSAKTGANGAVALTAEMTDEEKRLADTISRIDGVGSCTTLITTGANKDIVGVIVVAEGASDMSKRIEIIRCVETATGATVDRIQVYQMANGG